MTTNVQQSRIIVSPTIQYSTGNLVRKRATRKAGRDLQEHKKLWSRYTEVSVECTHSQIRNPAWTSFPVSYEVSGTVVRHMLLRRSGLLTTPQHRQQRKVLNLDSQGRQYATYHRVGRLQVHITREQAASPPPRR